MVLRVQRALILARAGEPARALSQAEEVLQEKDLPAEHLYDLARAHALCAAGDEETAARAVELLRRAVAKGYKNIARLKQESDLKPLHSRPDFQDLLRHVEGKPQ